MARQLLVLRHAKSDWRLPLEDFERPLKKRGKKAAKRIGKWLVEQNLVPDYILSSPAERARQTAYKVCKAMGFDKQQIHFEPRLYACDVTTLVAELSLCPNNSARVLLIGHNPELEALLDFLHHDDLERPEDGKLLPTAALAMFNMPDDWQTLNAGCAQLVSLTRVDALGG